MTTRASSAAILFHQADVSYVREHFTSCENGYLNTSSQPDSLANASRQGTFFRPPGSNRGGFLLPTPIEVDKREGD